MSVQSLLLAGNFCTTNSSLVLAQGKLANFREFSEKNIIFYEHPVGTVDLKMRSIPLKDLDDVPS